MADSGWMCGLDGSVTSQTDVQGAKRTLGLSRFPDTLSSTILVAETINTEPFQPFSFCSDKQLYFSELKGTLHSKGLLQVK